METVSLTYHVDAPPEAVREVIGDIETFMEAAGFDQVELEEDTLRLAQTIGLGRIELVLKLVDDPDAVLRYDQIEGIFEEMTTTYIIEPVEDGTEVTVTTEFTLGGVAGTVLDSTIIRRQRTRELNAQFEYLDDQVA